MPPNMAGQHYPSAPNAADYEMSFGDTSMEEYFEWPPDSSVSGYPSTNSRSGYQHR
ncbi:hypothetical protein C8R44DRAFT_887046 [Mycena epipterygia]|nr:hypothetical protein C8R44DRAFT_887046 [Mycena epipterygia]